MVCVTKVVLLLFEAACHFLNYVHQDLFFLEKLNVCYFL